MAFTDIISVFDVHLRPVTVHIPVVEPHLPILNSNTSYFDAGRSVHFISMEVDSPPPSVHLWFTETIFPYFLFSFLLFSTIRIFLRLPRFYFGFTFL